MQMSALPYSSIVFVQVPNTSTHFLYENEHTVKNFSNHVLQGTGKELRWVSFEAIFHETVNLKKKKKEEASFETYKSSVHI